MRLIATLLLAFPAGAAIAAPPAPPFVRAITGVDQAEGNDRIVAHVLLANMSENRAVDAPDQLDAMLHVGERDVAVRLVRQGPAVQVPPRGWSTADYGFAPPTGLTGTAVLSLGVGHDGYAFALAKSGAPALASTTPAPTARDAGTQSAVVLANLSTYEPVYGLVGAGTDSNVKIQFSFQYQLFGHTDQPPTSWLDGFRVAYTQTIYWDVAANSQPIRDVSYQPELFYIHQWPANAQGLRLSARGGVLHESNGRGGLNSRGYQYLYVQPQLNLALGDYTLSVGPRLFHYIFGRDINQDIARYRGHQALALSIGRQDGLKLSTFSRFNFSSGKGSIDADLSYPLRRIIGRTPLYIVVQGFTGYGEDLLDYNRRQTRVRVGLGIIR